MTTNQQEIEDIRSILDQIATKIAFFEDLNEKDGIYQHAGNIWELQQTAEQFKAELKCLQAEADHRPVITPEMRRIQTQIDDLIRDIKILDANDDNMWEYQFKVNFLHSELELLQLSKTVLTDKRSKGTAIIVREIKYLNELLKATDRWIKIVESDNDHPQHTPEKISRLHRKIKSIHHELKHWQNELDPRIQV